MYNRAKFYQSPSKMFPSMHSSPVTVKYEIYPSLTFKIQLDRVYVNDGVAKYAVKGHFWTHRRLISAHLISSHMN